jgi:hypothetical protein
VSWTIQNTLSSRQLCFRAAELVGHSDEASSVDMIESTIRRGVEDNNVCEFWSNARALAEWALA